MKQNSVGSVPAMKTSSRVVGHCGVASCSDCGSIATCTTPDGDSNAFVSLYSGSATACFMKSPQIGAAAMVPESPRSRLSSKPTQITHTRFDVNPANKPSHDVHVFPAAGGVKPIARTDAPVPRL